jgi:hypothetical protein
LFLLHLGKRNKKQTQAVPISPGQRRENKDREGKAGIACNESVSFLASAHFSNLLFVVARHHQTIPTTRNQSKKTVPSGTEHRNQKKIVLIGFSSFATRQVSSTIVSTHGQVHLSQDRNKRNDFFVITIASTIFLLV